MTKDDAVPVTPEARKAAADLLDEVSSLLGDDGIGQVADLIRDGEYDEHDATIAFAKFERDILARHRGSTAGVDPIALLHEHDEDGEVEVELYRHGAGCLTDADRAAGWKETFLYAAQTPATPMVQEGLREALDVGEKFLNACFSAWSCGEPYHRVKTMMDRADEFRAALDALAATPAPPVDETDRLPTKALRAAEQFIVNGIEMGYITMPDAETPDTAHDTLPLIRAALADRNQEGEVRRG